MVVAVLAFVLLRNRLENMGLLPGGVPGLMRVYQPTLAVRFPYFAWAVVAAARRSGLAMHSCNHPIPSALGRGGTLVIPLYQQPSLPPALWDGPAGTGR